jgi:1-acyl-sn-glycerol-3-phosphate acyltransferase
MLFLLQQPGKEKRGTARSAREEVLYYFGRLTIGMYAHLVLQMDVVRHTPLPSGPKIIAANHPTTTDPFLIMLLTLEPMSILVTEAAFRVPVFGRYLLETSHVPAARNSAGATVAALEQAVKEGRTVSIFPEGAISPSAGGFHQPHTGIARVALRTGAPVIPVGIGLQRERIQYMNTGLTGQNEVLTWYTGGQYAMTVGEPLHFAGDVEDRAYVRSVAAQIMRRIARLAGQSARRVEQVPARSPLPGASPVEVM